MIAPNTSSAKYQCGAFGQRWLVQILEGVIATEILRNSVKFKAGI